MTAHCSSKYSDKNSNLLSRIINTFVGALTTKYYLPEYIIIFLDDNLVEFLQYKKFAVASLLGPWIEYLCQFIADALTQRYETLSPKCRPVDKTQVYWVEAAIHENFNCVDQKVCEIFNQCLEANCQLYEFLRLVKIHDLWDKKDDKLVVNGHFTKFGLHTYWKAMDATVKYNMMKRQDFMVQSKFRALKKTDENGHSKKFAREDVKKKIWVFKE